MIWQLALHDLRGRYAATLVGSLWAIVNPLVVILVFWFVSAYGLKLSFEGGRRSTSCCSAGSCPG